MEQASFDLLIVDLIMPKMDGFHFMQELKNKSITTPKIVFSILSQEEDIKKAKQLGALAFLVKSDTPLAKLVEYIQNILK